MQLPASNGPDVPHTPCVRTGTQEAGPGPRRPRCHAQCCARLRRRWQSAFTRQNQEWSLMGDVIRGDLLLCAIPLTIQTWQRGRQGVALSFLPFSTNKIPLTSFNWAQVSFPFKNPPQRHLFCLKNDFNGLIFLTVSSCNRVIREVSYILHLLNFNFFFLNPFPWWSIITFCPHKYCRPQFSLFHHKAWLLF